MVAVEWAELWYYKCQCVNRSKFIYRYVTMIISGVFIILISLFIFLWHLQLWDPVMGATDGRGPLQRYRHSGCGVWHRCQQTHTPYSINMPGNLLKNAVRYVSIFAVFHCLINIHQIQDCYPCFINGSFLWKSSWNFSCSLPFLLSVCLWNDNYSILSFFPLSLSTS